MRKKVLVPLIVIAVVAIAAAAYFYPPVTATAGEGQYDTFSGDKKAACEALLCLSTGKRPDQCDGPIRRYFSIKHKKWKDTRNARKNFLKLCPDDDNSGKQGKLVDVIVDSAGRCDAVALNRNKIDIGWDEESIMVIDNRMPQVCYDYYDHTYTADNELPMYVGTPEQDGFWCEAADYETEYAAWEYRQEQKRLAEERRRAEEEHEG